MDFWTKIWEILSATMETPTMYGGFHILCWGITLGSAALLCLLYKRGHIKNVRRVVFLTAILVLVLEVYKLVIMGILYGDKTKYEFPWKSFPWQFCSMPMYLGLLVGVTRGKVHNAICCFLATFAVFAGTAVMVYPGDVFIEIAGVNVQTMVCHGSMLVIGIFLYYTNHVKAELKTLFKALPVFVICLTSAVLVNEVAYRVGINNAEDFNMFYVSPYEEGYLPIYSYVQEVVPYPWCLLIYIAGFTLVAFGVLVIAMAIKGISSLKKESGGAKHDRTE